MFALWYENIPHHLTSIVLATRNFCYNLCLLRTLGILHENLSDLIRVHDLIFSCRGHSFVEGILRVTKFEVYWVFFRGIEWSLRALASMRAVRSFLRARAVIKYVLRAASTLKNSDGEQRALRKFSGQNLHLSMTLYWKETFCAKLSGWHCSTNPSSLQPIVPCCLVSLSELHCSTPSERSRRSKAF